MNTIDMKSSLGSFDPTHTTSDSFDLLSFSTKIDPAQETQYERLQERSNIPYDEMRVQHQVFERHIHALHNFLADVMNPDNLLPLAYSFKGRVNFWFTLLSLIKKRAKWDNDDYVCRGLILNGMSDSLFDIYQNVETSKELCDTPEAKYMNKDASSSHLRIKESLRANDNDKIKGNNVVSHLVVNMVEHNNSSRYNDNKGKRKHHDTKADPNKKPKMTCWKCVKPGHSKKDCKAGATVDVYKDRCWFKNYESLNDGSILHMENESTALVHGRGCVDLRNKKYFVTFIDDASRFGYVYLLHSKDEALDIFKVFKTKVELQQGSLIKRGIECIFVGYVEHSKDFRFYVFKPNDSVVINFIIESRDAIFDENRFSSVPRPSQKSLVIRTKEIGGSVVLKKVTEEVVQQPEPELKKSKRNRSSKDFRLDFHLYLIKGTRDEVSDQHFYCFNVEDDPKTFDEAMKFQDVAF
nr:zinc finger, CCHC-type [Tanacetum cinerariifolium]